MPKLESDAGTGPPPAGPVATTALVSELFAEGTFAALGDASSRLTELAHRTGALIRALAVLRAPLWE
jgi:hypothetical protein